MDVKKQTQNYSIHTKICNKAIIRIRLELSFVIFCKFNKRTKLANNNTYIQYNRDTNIYITLTYKKITKLNIDDN